MRHRLLTLTSRDGPLTDLVSFAIVHCSRAIATIPRVGYQPMRWIDLGLFLPSERGHDKAGCVPPQFVRPSSTFFVFLVMIHLVPKRFLIFISTLCDCSTSLSSALPLLFCYFLYLDRPWNQLNWRTFGVCCCAGFMLRTRVFECASTASSIRIS